MASLSHRSPRFGAVNLGFTSEGIVAIDWIVTSPKSTEPCPVARTLDIVGDRWTILILRELLTNPSRRFQEMEASLRGISPNTLSARLKKLEEHGIVTRRVYEEHPPRAEYVLTPKGRELGPALQALLVWGRKHTG